MVKPRRQVDMHGLQARLNADYTAAAWAGLVQNLAPQTIGG